MACQCNQCRFNRNQARAAETAANTSAAAAAEQDTLGAENVAANAGRSMFWPEFALPRSVLDDRDGLIG
ncbi:MAG TPA: hypothetical protein IAB57_08810 [Candidatus Fimivivens faecavium]|nr:hypothetical protein [Candidatus Fimivivens faecavium]